LRRILVFYSPVRQEVLAVGLDVGLDVGLNIDCGPDPPKSQGHDEPGALGRGILHSHEHSHEHLHEQTRGGQT
jgi:hypothetical protein